MKVLIVNPILYTSETHEVKKVNSIRDTMIYDLCLAFMKNGDEVTLVGAMDYKPADDGDYPFEIIWLDTKFKKILFPNVIPFCPDIKKLVKSRDFDLIITSEVFSLNSLMLARRVPERLIVWHELAKHNAILKRIPSRLWYGVIARLFFRKALIVPRSLEAKNFISKYCRNVSEEIIDHGVNLDKFTPCTEKENYFAVSSQLIPRKQIDKILDAFSDYLKKYDAAAKLYIMGEGELEAELKAQCEALGISESVVFTGRLAHDKLTERLKKAKAMLVYTRKDNNMVSIVESIAVCTPVVTTSVPYNASYIKENRLGIVSDDWGADELYDIAKDSGFISACETYRDTLSTLNRAKAFKDIKRKYLG